MKPYSTNIISQILEFGRAPSIQDLNQPPTYMEVLVAACYLKNNKYPGFTPETRIPLYNDYLLIHLEGLGRREHTKDWRDANIVTYIKTRVASPSIETAG